MAPPGQADAALGRGRRRRGGRRGVLTLPGAELDEVAERHLGAALERAAVHAGAVAAAQVLDEELAFSRPYREVAGGHGLVGQHQVTLASAPHEEDAPADQEAGARSFRYQQLKLVHAASIARRMWRAPERLVTAL